MKRQTIWLIRHSTTEGVEKRWLYGWTDLPLSEGGRRLLADVRAEGVYPKAEGKKLYSSGLLRATQTLQGIYDDAPFEIDRGFMEMNVGIFECKTYEELLLMPEYHVWSADATGKAACPGGESRYGFGQRVCGALEALIARGEREAVVVCHGGTIAAILFSLFGDEEHNFYNWVPAPARGYVLSVLDGKAVSASEL